MRLAILSIQVKETGWQIPYAAARLKASVDARKISGLETILLTFTTADSADLIFNAVRAAEPDILGFSLYVWNWQLMKGLARKVRQDFPAVQLVAGGPEAGFLQEADSDLFDALITGEGEIVFAELVTDFVSGTVSGGAVKDLGKLPSPYLTGTLDAGLYPDLLWELSRGCPYNCAFCYESRGQKGVRFFSLETAAAELSLFQAAGVEHVFVLDPTFNFDRSRAKEILRLIAQNAPDVHFVIEVRAELMDEETVDLFSQINCSLQIGIQSIHPAVLKRINRSMNVDLFVQNVGCLNEAEVIYGFDLIYGLPGDTLQGFYESFDFTMDLLPNHVDIFPLTVLPGTELFDKADDLDLKFLRENPYRLISSKGFSAEAMAGADRFSAAFDAFYNQGKAVPWFNLFTRYLEILPSDFFLEVAAIKEKDADEAGSLLQWQLDSLKSVFCNHNAGDVLPAAQDIVRIFSGTEPEVYDPDDLMEHLENGITALDELSVFVRKK